MSLLSRWFALSTAACLLLSGLAQAQAPLLEPFELPRTHFLWKWRATAGNSGIKNMPNDLSEYEYVKLNERLPLGISRVDYLPTAFLNDVTEKVLASLPVPSVEFGLHLICDKVTEKHIIALGRFKSLRRLYLESHSDLTDTELRAIGDLYGLTQLEIRFSVASGTGRPGKGATDQGIQQIRRLEQLHSLTITNIPVSDLALKELAGLPQLSSLKLYGRSLTDAGISEFKRLPNLKLLGLYGQAITDEGANELYSQANLWLLDLGGTNVNGSVFKNLAGTKQLEWLLLRNCRLTEVGLAEVCKLKQLKCLDIGANGIGDEGLRSIAGLPELTLLNIERTSITDAGCAYLPQLQHLRHLDLFGTKISDEALPHIVTLQELRHLNLSRTKVTDAGMSEVAKLKRLEFLDLQATEVTDVGLEQLATIKTLTKLYLPPRVSKEAVNRLRQALPKLGT